MFKIIKKSKLNKARSGILKTAHGEIQTPFFMPDATRAVVKNVGQGDIDNLNMPAMVVNTLHLYLQPGMNIIRKAGGVNKFMNFNAPLLSDSGGFQVFSLIHQSRDKTPMGSITNDGAMFKSPLNGSKHFLTPEKSIQIQFDLGTDMIIALDDCPPNDSSREEIKKAVNRTIFWAERCRKEYDKQVKKRKLNKETKPLIFGVIQGGNIKSERKRCAKALVEIGFDGLGFGARPVDNSGKFLEEILDYTARLIPENYFRFGLGIGLPEDIARCARMGWDMFDCVIPTREGRHGRLFEAIKNYQLKINNFENKKFYKTININNAKFKTDFSFINKNSKIAELQLYTKAYLHHLFKAKDPLGQRLASLNNLEFYLDLMDNIRYNIK